MPTGPAPEPPTGAQVELRWDDQSVTVVEVGGGLRSYTAGGRPVLDGYGPDEQCTGGRGQILLPWPNRLRDGRYRFGGGEHQTPLSEPERHNAIHGLVRWANWSVAATDGRQADLALVLHPAPGYPFTLALGVSYRLGPDGLTVSTTATNVGTGPCPYGAGAHPYLTTGSATVDQCLLRAPGTRRLLTDDRGIPTGVAAVEGTEFDFRRARAIGTTILDTGYTELERAADGRASVELTDDRTGVGVDLWMDETYPYLMLFTGDTLAGPERRRGLAAEPMTCAPNALQSGDGLVVLEPGETLTSVWGIRPLPSG
jgi:aldose 1-epimerase